MIEKEPGPFVRLPACVGIGHRTIAGGKLADIRKGKGRPALPMVPSDTQPIMTSPSHLPFPAMCVVLIDHQLSIPVP